MDFKNWKTSLAGAAIGLPEIILGILAQDWPRVINGVAAILLGYFAKDKNVTGS